MLYFDNSATTRPCPPAVDAAARMLQAQWHNPSALYGPAVAVEREIEAARRRVADTLGVPARAVTFTGSGTEADALAILGAAALFRGPRRVLIFAGEHSAVRETAPQLEAMGHTVQWIAATDEGLADLAALDGLLGADVALVSCMHVGNETGAVQPIAEIARRLRTASPDALLHVDGVQAFLRLPQTMPQIGADLYSVSAHKVHGPKGVGALAVRSGVRIAPQLRGGGQEGGLRSGTLNTAGIAGFAAAVDWMRARADTPLREMKLCLHQTLASGIEGLRVNGPPPGSDEAAPHILNVSFPGVGGEVMLHALEAEGVLVATGAACSSKKRGMSATFAAMGAPQWAADSAVRFSLGMMNTIEEARLAGEAAVRCYAKYKAFQRR